MLVLEVGMAAPHLVARVSADALADLRLGVRQKSFRIVSEAAAMDLINGTVSQAMRTVALGRGAATARQRGRGHGPARARHGFRQGDRGGAAAVARPAGRCVRCVSVQEDQARNDDCKRRPFCRAAQDRHADHHQRGGDLSEEPAVPRPLQSVDRELVHRHLDPLHVSGAGADRRLRRDLRVRHARSELLRPALLHGRGRCARRDEEADHPGDPAEVAGQPHEEGGPRRRDDGELDDGGRLRRPALERPVARRRRDPQAQVPVHAGRRHGRPWRAGGARGQRARSRSAAWTWRRAT